MSFKLTPLVQRSGPAIMVQRPVLLIGRHPECDLRLDLPKISRRHCCLASAYDRVLIRDLGSRNGVRVNGRIVEEVRLRAGDEVAIGPILFRLEGPALESPAPAAPVGATRPAPGADPTPNGPEPQWALDDSHLDLVPLDDL